VRDDRPADDTTSPAVWFAYSPDRKGEHPKRHLEHFRGALQADAYAGFHHLYEGRAIYEAACWASARRKFHEIHLAHPSPITTEAIARIGSLYGIEQEIRGSTAEIPNRSGRPEQNRCSTACTHGWRRCSVSSPASRTRLRRFAMPSHVGVLLHATRTTATTTTPPNARSASSPLDARTSSSRDQMPETNAPRHLLTARHGQAQRPRSGDLSATCPRTHRRPPHQQNQ
jgi:hypothetical protein